MRRNCLGNCGQDRGGRGGSSVLCIVWVGSGGATGKPIIQQHPVPIPPTQLRVWDARRSSSVTLAVHVQGTRGGLPCFTMTARHFHVSNCSQSPSPQFGSV